MGPLAIFPRRWVERRCTHAWLPLKCALGTTPSSLNFWICCTTTLLQLPANGVKLTQISVSYFTLQPQHHGQHLRMLITEALFQLKSGHIWSDLPVCGSSCPMVGISVFAIHPSHEYWVISISLCWEKCTHFNSVDAIRWCFSSDRVISLADLNQVGSRFTMFFSSEYHFSPLFSSLGRPAWMSPSGGVIHLHPRSHRVWVERRHCWQTLPLLIRLHNNRMRMVLYLQPHLNPNSEWNVGAKIPHRTLSIHLLKLWLQHRSLRWIVGSMGICLLNTSPPHCLFQLWEDCLRLHFVNVPFPRHQHVVRAYSISSLPTWQCILAHLFLSWESMANQHQGSGLQTSSLVCMLTTVFQSHWIFPRVWSELQLLIQLPCYPFTNN